ncbi:MAG: M20/M25/M40 family metallo-hydrolase [Lachnospiraceae bacterium]|nr:M20/M25/M40 family metallo-hydrolase [Lachnospiraceae bacterium]
MPVQKDRLVTEFEKLVSFDSESYHERKIADYLKAQLAELGLRVTEDRADEGLIREGVISHGPEHAGNVYGTLKGTAPGSPILFSAHMDTVKPGNGKQAVICEDGRITSAGDTVLGADDAGGLAAILEMLRVLREDGIPHPDLEVLFPIAEEPYGQGSRVFDYTQLQARKAFVFDLSGGLGRAAAAAPTILALQVTVKGRSAHAGFCPEEGIHAIRIAAEAMASLPSGWVDESTSINFGIISGGTLRNIVPDRVSIEGEIRSLDHEKALALADRVRTVFEETAARYGGSAQVRADVQIRAYRTDPDSETARDFHRACRETGLGEGELVDTFGGSDNNHFAQHGIEGLVVASAMQNVHTTEEYTTVSDLVKVAELAVALARKEERKEE